jgi:Family of unknown function (DUF6470)
MNLPQIRIQSTNIQQGFRTTNASLQIEQPHAEVKMEQPHAEMTIERIPSSLTVDSQQARNEIGIKSPQALMDEIAQLGKQAWLEGLGRTAVQGDGLMKIENGDDAIVNQAIENSSAPIYEFNIAFIPSYGSVKINYEASKVHIQWKVNKPIIQIEPQKPRVEYLPGKVGAFIERWNSLKIDYTGVTIDVKK